MALEKDRHTTSTPEDQRSPTPLPGSTPDCCFRRKRFQSIPPPPRTHSLPPLVLGLRSYQITDYSCEEKDLEVAITPITMTLPPGFLCLCPNLCQHPRLWLL